MGFFTSLFLFAVSLVMQQVAAKQARARQKKLEREAKERADAAKGFQFSTEGEAALLPVLYGRGLLAGVRVYHNTSNVYTDTAPAIGSQVFANSLTSSRSGVKHEFLTVQTAICFGDIQSCQMVMIDGKPYDDVHFNSAIGSAEYLDEGRLMGGHKIHFNPTGGVVDPLMTTNSGLSRQFTNTAYATAVYALNRDEYQYTGVPDAKFMCEGLKVYSIIGVKGSRSLSQTKAYSNNPALCLLDYLLNPIYGRGLDVKYLDLESFYYASQICDIQVLSSVALEGTFWTRKGGTRSIKLYECNLILSPSRTLRDNVETILETMGQAELVWSGGKYKISLEYPELYANNTGFQIGDVVQYTAGNFVDLYRAKANTTSPALASGDLAYLQNTTNWSTDVISAYLTDDDIIRGAENSVTWPNASERYNFCTVRFLNEAKDFVEDSVSWPFKLGTIPGSAIDKGIWSATGIYGTSDIVTYSAVKYQLKGSILFSGEWNSLSTYTNNERVTLSSVHYRAKNSPPMGTVVTNTTYWTVIATPATALAPNADNAWVIYDDTKVYNIFRAEDHGMPLEGDFFESGITDYYHALAKAEQRVRFSRSSTVYKLTLTTLHTNLEPGDFVKVTSAVLSIPGEVARVEEIKATPNGNLEVTFSKFDARSLAWNANDGEVVTPRTIFSGEEVGQCTGLAFSTASVNDTLSSGKLSWTPPSDIRVKSFIVKYTTDAVISATTTWLELGTTSSTSFELPSMTTGAYILTVIAQTGSGKSSPRNNGIGSQWPQLAVGNITAIGTSPIYIPLTVYTRKATAPATPTGGVFDFNSLTLTTVPTGDSVWSLTPPTGSEALYGSRAIAKTDSVATPDTSLSWSVPAAYSDTSIDIIPSKTLLGVGLDFDGNNAIYSVAVGNFQILVGGVDFALGAEPVYSIIAGSPVNCSVSVNNTTGASKGTYSVSSLTGLQGSFKVRVVFRAKTYDYTITVVALKDVYTKDLTAPPTPAGISVSAGLSTIYITSTFPSYTVGHGHAKTLIYGAIGTAPIFTDATKIGEFTGGITSIARNPNEQLHLWFKYQSIDGVNSVSPFGGTNGLTATTLKVTSDQIGLNEIKSENVLITGTGKALNDDPFMQDTSAWQISDNATGVSTMTVVGDLNTPVGNRMMRLVGSQQFTNKKLFPIVPNTRYKVSVWLKQTSVTTGLTYLRLQCLNSSGSLLSYVVSSLTPDYNASDYFENMASLPNTWTRFVGWIDAPASSAFGQLSLHVNWNTTLGTEIIDVCDFRAEEYIGADLIVDGSITANKLQTGLLSVGNAKNL